MKYLGFVFVLVLPALGGEYAVLKSGFRLHVDSHQTRGSVIRLQSGTGYVELPADQIAFFETEECAPALAPIITTPKPPAAAILLPEPVPPPPAPTPKTTPKPVLARRPAPDFTVKTLDGETYTLSSFKGRPVLLDFWATWCGVCHKSAPALDNLARGYAAQGVVVLAVSTEARSVVAAFAAKHPHAYAVVLGDRTMSDAYGIKGLPTFVLIDAAGMIAASQSGYGSARRLLAIMTRIDSTGLAR